MTDTPAKNDATKLANYLSQRGIIDCGQLEFTIQMIRVFWQINDNSDRQTSGRRPKQHVPSTPEDGTN